MQPSRTATRRPLGRSHASTTKHRSRRPAATSTFRLPEDGPATLELLDVSGRRLLVRDLGVLGLGAHSIDLAAGGRFPAGLYLVRLRTAAGERVKRVALLD